MKQLKKYVLIALLSILVFSQVQPFRVQAASEVTLTIHYNRPGKDYTGWNLWLWETGKDGKAYEFTESDDYGAKAVIKLTTDATEFGFIVRFKEWEQKDVGADRFISVSGGKAEVWLKNEDPLVYTEKPDLNAVAVVPVGDINLKIHYHRYDNVYTNWNLWAWPEGGDGASYPFNKTDSFGQLAEFIVTPGGASQIGFLVREGEWLSKDIDSDRFIPLTLAKNNTVEVWLVQGDPRIYTSLTAIDMSPKFLSAKLDNVDQISVKVTVPITLVKDNQEGLVVTDSKGLEQSIRYLFFSEGADPSSSSSFSIFFEKPLDLMENYTLSRKGYGSIDVVFNNVFKSQAFEDLYHFDGELGAIYAKDATEFRLWAPTATAVVVNLYANGNEDATLDKSLPLTSTGNGLWSLKHSGDLNKTYYTYTVSFKDGRSETAVDPYARAVGVNGLKAMVVDLDATDPEGWSEDKQPTLENNTDAIIYELHVRDVSTSPDSGITNKGKFLGLSEKGTVNSEGLSTGLDHLSELGITHVHLLPVFDFRSIDETNLDNNSFNWGYDPQHFNVPEGSYSTDPTLGEVRVKEFKQMVKSLHDEGLGVIMDVVYNHTGASADSDFSKIVPGYYYRFNANGSFSNGSGTGNETASERSMVRKFIVDSVVYWATEYHIDGFRFDLMALHDIDTMKAVKAALEAVNPNILIYGEGWTGGSSPLPDASKSLKVNVSQLDDIAVFSDDMRDALKGHVFTATDPGFVNGGQGLEESLKFGIVASVLQGDIDYKQVKYSKYAYATSPTQIITYVESHDNLTLWDKLMVTNGDEDESIREAMVRLTYGILFTSQGITFMQAGDEFLRSKDGNENSYNAPDSVNQLDWINKSTYADTVDYFKGLINLRLSHPAFRMTSDEMVREHLNFLETETPNTLAYIIDGNANGDSWETIAVLLNANDEAATFTLEESGWDVMVNAEDAGVEKLSTIGSSSINVEPHSLLVLVKSQGLGMTTWLLIGLGAMVLAGLAAFYLRKKSPKTP